MARPRRIVLVRHGESMGNADDTVYEREPDHALALTERGWRQAEETGKHLREVFGGERVSVYVSPYRRTHETLQAFRPRPRADPGPRGAPAARAGLGKLAGPRGRPAAEGLPRRLRALLLPLRAGRERRRRLRPGRAASWRACSAASRPPTTRPTSCSSPTAWPCGCSACAGSTGRSPSSSPWRTRATAETRMLRARRHGRYTLDRPFDRWRGPACRRARAGPGVERRFRVRVAGR